MFCQLTVLQRAILRAVQSLPEGGPQVRFHGCSHKPGWLQLTCADDESAKWLEEAAETLQPWEGARVRFVGGADLPRPHVCVAYLPDDGEDHCLSPDDVLTRLRRMNRNLNTREWVVLYRESRDRDLRCG